MKLQTGPQRQKVSLVRNAKGERGFRVDDGGLIYVVPLSIAALSAGRDAWMRQLLAECANCGKTVKVEELYGESDLPDNCCECSVKYFTCQKCNSQHHPDDDCEVTK